MIEFVGQYYLLPLHFVFNACNFLSFILINFLNSGGFTIQDNLIFNICAYINFHKINLKPLIFFYNNNLIIVQFLGNTTARRKLSRAPCAKMTWRKWRCR